MLRLGLRLCLSGAYLMWEGECVGQEKLSESPQLLDVGSCQLVVTMHCFIAIQADDVRPFFEVISQLARTVKRFDPLKECSSSSAVESSRSYLKRSPVHDSSRIEVLRSAASAACKNTRSAGAGIIRRSDLLSRLRIRLNDVYVSRNVLFQIAAGVRYYLLRPVHSRPTIFPQPLHVNAVEEKPRIWRRPRRQMRERHPRRKTQREQSVV